MVVYQFNEVIMSIVIRYLIYYFSSLLLTFIIFRKSMCSKVSEPAGHLRETEKRTAKSTQWI